MYFDSRLTTLSFGIVLHTFAVHSLRATLALLQIYVEKLRSNRRVNQSNEKVLRLFYIEDKKIICLNK